MELPSLCSVCKRPALRKCTECLSSWYCSDICQNRDWDAHEILCNTYGILTRYCRKEPIKLAVLFPTESVAPRIIEVSCPQAEGIAAHYTGADYHTKDVDSQLISLDHINIRRSESLRDDVELQLIFFNESFTNELKANQSILEFTKGVCGNGWRGPVLAMKVQGRKSGNLRYVDVSLSDFGALASYLEANGNRSERIVSGCYPKNKVLGVEIYYEAGATSYTYAPVELPMDHAVLTAPESKLSRLANTPVRALRVGPKLLPKAQPILGSYRNIYVACLYLNLEPNNASWGRVLDEWQGKWTANVLVVRSDGMDLGLEQLEMLCSICMEKLHKIILDRTLLKRQETLSSLTPESFQNSAIQTANLRVLAWQRFKALQTGASNPENADGQDLVHRGET